MDKHIFKNLSWNTSLDGQKEAINKLALMYNLNPSDLIQPQGKEYWENAARALYLIRYPRIEEAIPGLFKWIQDLNWPGALIVMELLKSLPKEAMIRHLESAALDAIHANDDIWLFNLSTFLTEYDLHEDDFISSEVYSVLASSLIL